MEKEGRAASTMILVTGWEINVSDLIESVQAKSDAIRVVVVTRDYHMEGELHCPRVGREGRRLTNLLNSQERNFLVLTGVQVMERQGGRTSKSYPLIQVSLNAVEFICPHLDAEEAEQEFRAH
jgi:hypothetical protein